MKKITVRIKEKEKEKLSNDELLQALEIYSTDWQHRDNIMWKVNTMFFYATLICSIIPFLDIKTLDEYGVPIILFPVAGICLSICFAFVSLSYSSRLEADGDTVLKIIDLLPKEIRRVNLKETKVGKLRFTQNRMGTWVPTLPLFLLSIFITFYILNKKGKTFKENSNGH